MGQAVVPYKLLRPQQIEIRFRCWTVPDKGEVRSQVFNTTQFTFKYLEPSQGRHVSCDPHHKVSLHQEGLLQKDCSVWDNFLGVL